MRPSAHNFPPPRRNDNLFRKSSPLVVAILVILGVVFGSNSPSLADTKAYELIGDWVNKPETATSGKTVVSALWKFDVNDDKPAPANDKVNGNILQVSLENARFAKLPTDCLTESSAPKDIVLDPQSSISDDGKTLVCNLGPRVQGTAELALTSLIADGPSGSNITAEATFRGLQAKLSPILIKNAFIMDAQFNLGAPTSTVGDPQSEQWVTFPFSLSHAQLSPAGPDAVTIDVTVTSDIGQDVLLREPSCLAVDSVNPGYPFSDTAHDKAQSTAFADCDFKMVGKNKFQLTLSGLKYDGTYPALDSNGEPLPSGMDVITAGQLQFKTNYGDNGGLDTVKLTAGTPTYRAVDGQTSTDDPTNNTNAAPMVRGSWTGGWTVANQIPKAYPGIPWSNTSLAPSGASVMSVSGLKAPNGRVQRTNNWICQVLDTEHVTFQRARASLTDSPYDNNFPGQIWYYTGEIVDPVSGEPVDPNEFTCGTTIDRNDPAAGNPPGWSTNPPADPTKVKAVKIEITSELATSISNTRSMVLLVVDQQIKPDTPIGTDIWTWTVPMVKEGRPDWAWDDMGMKAYGHSRDVADKQPYETATPGLRYAFSGPGRDVLRVVGSEPLVQALVAQSVYGPGQAVDYTIKYGLETVMANPAPDTVVVTDTLAQGMTYVANSAPTEPTITTSKAGNQVLTWTFENILPNKQPMNTFNFKASVPADAASGSKFVNNVSAKSQNIERSDFVEITVPDSGYTALTQSAKQSSVELENNRADGGWIITLESQNPTVTKLTDVIDILPFNGDERGTNYVGAVSLKQVKAPEGASVYFTTADPSTINEDPADPANGAVGTPSDMWSTEFTPDATAIRIINNQPLSFGQQQVSEVSIHVEGAQHRNLFVNTAVARTDAESTQMRMRSSAQFQVIEPNWVPPQPPTPPSTTQPPTPPATQPPAPKKPTPKKPGLPHTGADGAALPALVGIGLFTAAASIALNRRRHR